MQTVVFDWLESKDGTKSLAIAPPVAAAAVTSWKIAKRLPRPSPSDISAPTVTSSSISSEALSVDKSENCLVYLSI